MTPQITSRDGSHQLGLTYVRMIWDGMSMMQYAMLKYVVKLHKGGEQMSADCRDAHRFDGRRTNSTHSRRDEGPPSSRTRRRC